MIAARVQGLDELPFSTFDPRSQLRPDMPATCSFPEQPWHEQEVAGAGKYEGGSREECVAERVPDPAEPELVATLALREHRHDLSRAALVGLGVVEPREDSRRHVRILLAVTFENIR